MLKISIATMTRLNRVSILLPDGRLSFMLGMILIVATLPDSPNSSDLLLQCGTLILPNRLERDWCVFVRAGVIQEVCAHFDAPAGTQVIDAREHLVLPGFVDTHVHGAMDADTMDATSEALHTMARFFARHGVTGFLPTTMTATSTQIDKAIDAVQQVHTAQKNKPWSDAASILGVHIEGPYVNPKQRGAQPAQFMRLADPTEYCRWFDTGVVRLITLAPEMGDTNHQLIRDSLEHGVAVAIGHTDASYEQARQAFALGANQATHTFNAMRQLQQRAPGVVGAVLNNPAVFAQLICDNVHVHPATMQILYKCKGAGHVALITDAMEATGMGDGDFKLGAGAAADDVFVRGGKAQLSDGTLAGSLATMDLCLRNIIAATGCSLVEAAQMAAHTPAASIGLGARKGCIEAGYDADFAILTPQLEVQRTIVAGQTVFQTG